MSMLNNLPGESVDIGISERGVGKPQYFASGATGYKIPPGTPAEVSQKWRSEYDLCDCSTCYDRDCRCRNKNIRFPVDAGGQNQCLRLMQTKTPFVFRLATGLVIELPLEMVQRIRGTEE